MDSGSSRPAGILLGPESFLGRSLLQNPFRSTRNPFRVVFSGESLPQYEMGCYHPPMPRYSADEHLAYFCTITILEWLPVLIDRRYAEPIFDSLRYCRREKALKVMAYVLMPNHLHLIAGCDGNLQAVVRDFKRYTSRAVHDLLKTDGRHTILRWLSEATEPRRRAAGELGLWQPGFHPQAIVSDGVFQQKLQYLHENPVRKGLVVSPQDWWYSSARIAAGLRDAPMDVDPWMS